MRRTIAGTTFAAALACLGPHAHGQTTGTAAQAPKVPNLYVVVATPAQLMPGASLALDIAISNSGSGFVGTGWLVRAYLSTDSTISATDTKLGEVPGQAVVAGDTYKLNVTYPMPPVPAGSYYVGVVVDATNVVAELTEADNVGRRKVTLYPPVPNVSSYSPTTLGLTGFTITFLGRDFNPAFFTAAIGGINLKVTSAKTDRVTALLPNQRMKGDLVVGHGAPGNQHKLATGYRVVGEPVITGMTPTSFSSTVTLTGLDLDVAQPLTIGTQRFVKIGSDANSWGTGFLNIGTLQKSADGTTASFTVNQTAPVWSIAAMGATPTVVSPTPASLSGTVRLAHGSNLLNVVGPMATWSPAPYTVSSLSASWGSQPVNFILVDPVDPWANRVAFTGSGLLGSTVNIGTTAINRLAINADGQGGLLYLPYNAQTNYVTFSRSGMTARSPKMLTVAAEPRTTDTTKMKIKLDSVVSITGWDLTAPGSVQGLTYTFEPNYVSSLTNCQLQFELVSHTTNRIELRIRKTSSAISPTCLGGSLFTSTNSSHYLQLNASYGGVKRTVWQRSYYLVQ